MVDVNIKINEGFERQKQKWGYSQLLSNEDTFQVQYLILTPYCTIGPQKFLATDKFLYVLSGFGRIIVEGTAYELRPGDRVTITRGQSHSILSSPNVDLVILETSTPGAELPTEVLIP